MNESNIIKQDETGGVALPQPCSPTPEPTPRTDDFISYSVRTDHNWRTFARQLERELAAARKALMICEGAMMGKVNPKSVAFKAVGAILRPENAKVCDAGGQSQSAS